MGLVIPRMVMDIATLHGVCAVGGNLLDVDVDGLDIPFVGPVVMCDRREVLDGAGAISYETITWRRKWNKDCLFTASEH